MDIQKLIDLYVEIVKSHPLSNDDDVVEAIRTKARLQEELENFKLEEQYSYYVGTEIMANRMPDKFGKWSKEVK